MNEFSKRESKRFGREQGVWQCPRRSSLARGWWKGWWSWNCWGRTATRSWRSGWWQQAVRGQWQRWDYNVLYNTFSLRSTSTVSTQNPSFSSFLFFNSHASPLPSLTLVSPQPPLSLTKSLKQAKLPPPKHGDAKPEVVWVVISGY